MPLELAGASPAQLLSNHITANFAELQVADRAEAIVRARDAGLGHSP
ncbi:hypothetical protein [Dactylosporangium sp. CA-139066]